jgi:hypothetical protein
VWEYAGHKIKKYASIAGPAGRPGIMPSAIEKGESRLSSLQDRGGSIEFDLLETKGI